MRKMEMRCALIAGVLLFCTPLAHAADPASANAGSDWTFVILLECGLMGLVGQSARIIVGMASMMTAGGNMDNLDLRRLVVGLIIGFAAGFIFALGTWANLPASDTLATHIETGKFSVMLQYAIAGYIGADAISPFTSLFLAKTVP